MESTLAIETINLTKRFDKTFTALDKVNIKIQQGEVVGYVGQNGAGKTTTIKVLTNLLKPDAGTVLINGINVTKRPKEALTHVGALIEVPGVYDFLTPHEILTYFGKIYRIPNINNRIKEVLSLLNIEDWEYKQLSKFSTGMQRRFGIAKAILHEPKILILDEPVLGLDPKGMKDIRELVRRLNKQGMTIFISSHLLQELSETVDRVIFIKKGRIVEADTIENIKEKIRPEVIHVILKDPPHDEQIKALGNLKHVRSIERINRRELSIRFHGGTDAIVNILKQAVLLDINIISYQPQTTDLEEYYLQVMGDLEVS